MPEVQIKPAVLNIEATHGDKYNLVLNRKNTVTGAAENVTGTYKVLVRRKGATTAPLELTGAPDVVIAGSQLQIKMDNILALAAGDYDMVIKHIDGAVERTIGFSTLKIKPTL
jgi:hypothetical protein